MIAHLEANGQRLITQPDHARFSAELMGLWRADGLPEHPRRDELLFAIREHDNGWRETDAAPRVDPATAAPLSFLDLPAGPRVELWTRGVARFADSHPYAAALILEHSVAIHASRRGAEWDEFRDASAVRRESLLEAAAVDPADLEADYRWLDLADTLSLAVCTGRDQPFEHRGVGARFDPRCGELALAPFPLAGATTFEIPCRFLTARRYAGDADLGAALAACRWERLRVRVVGP